MKLRSSEVDRAGFKRHWVAHVIVVQQQLSIPAVVK
jgi:hypothetical protein